MASVRPLEMLSEPPVRTRLLPSVKLLNAPPLTAAVPPLTTRVNAPPLVPMELLMLTVLAVSVSEVAGAPVLAMAEAIVMLLVAASDTLLPPSSRDTSTAVIWLFAPG